MNKPIVFIGSSVVDVLLHLPHLPSQSEDINISTQSLSLGGCAFNAAWIAHLLQVHFLLFSPIGTGIYADFIRKEMHAKGFAQSLLQSEEENGCCYCLIDKSGERSFLSYHGAEYKFHQEWFQLLDQQDVDTVYVCGLEIEEDSGSYILDYLEAHPLLCIYFASGPRLLHIAPNKMQRILHCHPILHLNEAEALAFTKTHTLMDAANSLFTQTQNTIIITLGERGCCYRDETGFHIIEGYPVEQIDTTGAGDCHIGSIIAYRALGYTLEDSLHFANRMAAKVVAQNGAILSSL